MGANVRDPRSRPCGDRTRVRPSLTRFEDAGSRSLTANTGATSLNSRSPVGTTAAQVASRLALVWGVCEIFPEVRQRSLLFKLALSTRVGSRRAFLTDLRGSRENYKSLSGHSSPGPSFAVLCLDGDGLVPCRDYPLYPLRHRPARLQDQAARVDPVRLGLFFPRANSSA